MPPTSPAPRAPDPPPTRLPTVIVTGAPASLRAEVARAIVARRPDTRRWVRVLAGAPAGVATASADADLPAVGLGAGCACCLAGPVFRTGLSRLIALTRPGGLIIDLAPGGHPDRLMDQLRSPPFVDRLAVDSVVHGAQSLASLESLDPWPAHAGELWLSGAADAGASTAASRDGLGAPSRPFATAPWPFVLATDAAHRTNASDRGDGVDPAAGKRCWQRYRPVEAFERPGWRTIIRPADRPVARGALAAALADFARDPLIGGFVALWRTPRAWYGWRHQRTPAGWAAWDEPGITAAPVAEEIGWRADNRIVVWPALPPTATDPASVTSLLLSVDARLADLMAIIASAPDGL